MSGFARIAFEGEYFNQQIVNVFHYRSTAWLPGQGNPFDDVITFLDAVLAELQASYLTLFPTDYTLRQATAVGYDDEYRIVTSSPLVRTVGAAGQSGYTTSMGAANCGILSLRLGEQFQINNTGFSARNRGYLALGPFGEAAVDNYSHLVANQQGLMNTFGAHVDNPITIVTPAVVLTPIRIHQKFANVLGVRVLLWRTYSDVLGYTPNAVASYRRSRQPEA